MPARPSVSWHTAVDRVFGLDVRGLAVLRICSALLLLTSLADRLRDFGAFFTDAGVLSEANAWTAARFEPWDGPSWLRPFGWLPDPWNSVALFTVAGVAAIFLLVGHQTRMAGFLAWLTLTGIDNRNPLIINGGDDLLRLLLFWGLFLPLSARWSLDARASRPLPSNRLVSAGSAAFLVQLALIYSMSALFKSYREWVTDRDALYYALHLQQFVTPLGIVLRDHIPTALLSAATWWFELIGPLLIFSPFATDRLRYLLVVAFSAMHMGIGLILSIGLFGYICVAAWIATLPSGFWEKVERLVASFELRARSPAIHGYHSTAESCLAVNACSTFFLGYVLLWNVWSLNPGRNEAWFPFGTRWLGYQLRIAQLWGMFSPAPPKESSWLQLRAQTADGKVASLCADGQLYDGKPITPERLLRERWRKFHERIVQEPTRERAKQYATFLLKRFRGSSPGTPATVSVVWIRKPSPPLASPHQSDLREHVTVLATAG